MVGAGRERSEAPSSARGGRGTSIPSQTLRRALYDSIGTPEGASSSAKLPTGRGGRGKKRATKGTRGGRGRGTKAATPSSPPPQLIHPSTGLLRWTRLRWRLQGLLSMSLGPTILLSQTRPPARLLCQTLRPARLLCQTLRPTRLHTLRPDGIPGRICISRSRVALLMVAGISFLIAWTRWLRGPPSTSVGVHGSRPCRRPASRGGQLGLSR